MFSRRQSARANGKRIRQVREQLGWTQAELAKRTGYTDRLIVKAEGGNSVSLETLNHICQAFSDAGLAISLGEVSSNPVELAREFLEGMYLHRGQVIDRTQHFLHPDVVFFFNGDPAVFPFAGRHEGIDAAREAFKLFFSILEPPEDLSELEAWEYLSADQGVLIWGDSWIHPIGMPMKEPVKVAVRCRFVDGLMTLFDDRFDTQVGAAVLTDR